MSVDDSPIRYETVDKALDDMALKEEASPEASTLDSDMANGDVGAAPTPQPLPSSPSPSPISSQQSPIKAQSGSHTPKSADENETMLGGEVIVKVENGKPKLSRKASQKVISRPAPLFDDLSDSTKEATSVFQVIKDCIYGSKYMGSSEHDALGCDCSEEWRKSTT